MTFRGCLYALLAQLIAGTLGAFLVFVAYIALGGH